MRYHCFHMNIRGSLVASLGLLVLIGAGCSPMTRSTSEIQAPTTTTPEMNRYTDATSGFSFSYPKTWTVTEESIASADDHGYLSGGTIIKRLRVEGVEDGDNRHMTFEEFHSPTRSITEFGVNDVSPVGEDKKYFFDEQKQAWMYTTLRSDAGPLTATTTADVSKKTTSGLPIFLGAARHDAEYIVPLNTENFVIVSEINGSWSGQPEAIVQSIQTLP